VLRTAAVATTALAAPFAQRAYAAASVVHSDSMVMAWYQCRTPLARSAAARGGATPDNFLNVLHDALIKNFHDELYDHVALAERYEFAEDARSTTFWLRPGVKFHNCAPVTPDDVKWSYEHYHGAWAKVLHDKTDGVVILDDRTLRFDFKEPLV